MGMKTTHNSSLTLMHIEYELIFVWYYVKFFNFQAR